MDPNKPVVTLVDPTESDLRARLAAIVDSTDDAVVWVRGLAIDNIQNGFQTPAGGKTEVEAYLSGNVIVRTKPKDAPLQTLRAQQVYYDVQRERAVALNASLEF